MCTLQSNSVTSKPAASTLLNGEEQKRCKVPLFSIFVGVTALHSVQLHFTEHFKQRRLSAEAKMTFDLLRVPPDQPAIESRYMA
jgi:hypothetical protein